MNRSTIEFGSDHSVILHLRRMVEDFYSGRYYWTPSKMIGDQTKEEISTTLRTDARTGKVYDPFNIRKGWTGMTASPSPLTYPQNLN